MWRASILALTVLLLAPAAAPARVLQDVTPQGTLAEGPLLAGARVAWEETRCLSREDCGFEASRRYRIQAAGPRRLATLARGRLRSLPGGSNSLFDSVSFDLSARRFALGWSAFGTQGEQDFWEGGLMFAGPDGGRLRRVFACRAERQDVENPFALAGELLAYDPNPCDDRPRLAFRNLGGGATRTSDLTPGGGMLRDLAAAGRYVASAQAGFVHLHDGANGNELFTAPLPPGALHGIDVSSDGRFAVSVGSERIGRRSCWRSRLWLHRAGGSALERQPASPCWDARLVNGGVAYLAGERRPQRLELFRTTGARRTVVRFGDRRARDSFDAQRARAAFAVRCGGRLRIRVISLAERAPAC